MNPPLPQKACMAGSEPVNSPARRLCERCRLALWILPLLWQAVSTAAAPAFDTSTPASFFTNAVNQVLLAETADWRAQNFAEFTNTFGTVTTNGFGLANIPVYVNGSFVYSPSVQRLLQVTANIFDASTTNPYPSVFRPTFYRDAISGNVFINGYQYIPSVSGLSDPRLSSPVDIAALAAGTIPGTGSGYGLGLNNVNVYGIPWNNWREERPARFQ